MLALYTGSAEAGDVSARPEIGASTQAWFAMQAAGRAAAAAAPMPGAQASAAYARYLKSFDAPIPDRFGSSIKDGVTKDGSGG
jgi:hypothetical protein